MGRHEISDENWRRIEDLLPGRRGGHGGVAKNNRLFINAIYFLAKTGIPWRDLPERFGKWNSVFQRFHRWSRTGVWARVFEALKDPDLEWLLIDSSVIRAHPHAGGMNTPPNDQALGYSRGGFGTKVHVGFDALGNPVSVVLSPGQDADVTHAPAVLGAHHPDAVLGDKGYDSDAFVALVEGRGAAAVIPSRKNRVQPREYDTDLYKERNKAERGINLFKQFRRAATRYEKTATNFLSIILFAAITIWLR
jgi:transposase